jgi:hypothetical protein
MDAVQTAVVVFACIWLAGVLRHIGPLIPLLILIVAVGCLIIPGLQIIFKGLAHL